MSAPLRTRKPNYNLLHAQPLPLTVVPLPPLIPHNPLSLLHILYAYLFSRAPAHPQPLYRGAFDSATSSVHVTDPASIQAFWNHGFFGKGSLSRSEPTWLSRRRRALGILGKDEALTAEEITERRRRERRDFKAERARAEKERIQRQLAEEGKLLDPAAAAAVTEEDRKSDSGSVRSVHFAPAADVKPSLAHAFDQPTPVPAVVVVADVRDLEHLQLTLEEAFFLAYGLGVLQITDPEDGGNTLDVHQLLDLARRHSYFPPLEPGAALEPDDPFLLNYVVYHHFRSLGWVVKPGIKFGVDYLLYNRGPVFSHAEFAILVLPAYSHAHWRNSTEKGTKLWHWLHCVNRVSSQVKKTVILVFVEIPPPSPPTTTRYDGGIKELLQSYAVREVGLRRWLVSRNLK